MLVIEDLHWADAAFVAFLEHVAERTAGLPLLVVVTARPEVEERHPSWPPGRRSTLLSLSPLTDDDLEALITNSLPEADPELIRVVLERAGGSPLYAEQLAAMLKENLVPIAGGALDEAMIPSSVQALIAARIDALPDEPKRVLMEASVVGRTFWLGAVSSFGDHSDLDATLRELVRREFCRPVHPSTMEGDLEFTFWHALVRDVAYAELTKAERARMHAETARWIAGRTEGAMGEDAEIVVHHLDAALEFAPAAPELDTRLLKSLLADSLISAGEAAARTDLPRAIPLVERALSNLPVDDDRELHAKRLLAGALSADGQHVAARPLLEEVIQRSLAKGDTLGAVRAADDLRSIHDFIGDVSASHDVLEDLGRQLGSTPSPALAEFMAIEADDLVFAGEYQEALQRSLASIALAEDLGMAPSLLAIGNRGQSRLYLGDKGGETDMRFAIDGMFRDGRTRETVIGFQLLGARVSEWDMTAGLEYQRESIALAERFGMDADAWNARGHWLSMLARLGRFDEVVSEAQPILDWATRTNDSATRSDVLASLARVEIHRGGSWIDLQELAELLRGRKQLSMLVLVARLAHARGEDDLARAFLGEAASAPRGNRAELAHTAVLLSLPALAEELLAGDGSNAPSDLAERAIAEAALAEARDQLSAAVQRFRDASAQYAELGLPVGRAGALLSLGRCLLKLGNIDDGIVQLRKSRKAWDEMKASLRIAEIDELLSTVSSSEDGSA